MVGIICVGQIELSPFVKNYTDVLEKNRIPYEIVHWNRSGKPMPDDDKNITYHLEVNRYDNIVKKILPYFKFRRFLKKTIKAKKYEKLIVLTTQTALIISRMLRSKYKGRYVFDYRDTSYENIKPYRNLINDIIKKSYMTSISSPGFKDYLTCEKELIVAHNFQKSNLENRAELCKKSDNEKIVIGYIGYLREYEYLIKFVDEFGKDSRFDFRIHGSGDCIGELREYAKKYPNVEVFGAYEEKDKMDIIDSFDMICYNYPKNFVNYPAVANKFYDGLIRKKPMFGNLDTFSGRLVKDNGLGISLEEKESNITDKIYDYYRCFDADEFNNNCEVFLSKVIEEDKYYMAKIEEFVKGCN